MDAEAVKQEVATLNANAVVERLELFQQEIFRLEERIEQQAEQIAHLEGRMNVEQQLRMAESFGSGPTA